MVGALESPTIHAADGEKHTRWQPLELLGCDFALVLDCLTVHQSDTKPLFNFENATS